MVKLCRGMLPLSGWEDAKMSDFYASSWQSGTCPIPMLILRVVCLTLTLAILTWSISAGQSVYWLLFLTNWGMVLVAAMCLFGVIVSIAAVHGVLTDDVKSPPWYVGTYWVFYNISIGMALVITVLYWTLLYGPELKEEKWLFYLELLNHAANSIIVVVEVVASRTPVRLTNVYQPLAVGTWYAVFTYLYYIAGGTDGNGTHFIYDLLDWHHMKRTLFIVILAIVALILLYFMAYGVAVGRDKLSEQFRTTSVNLSVI